MPALDLDVLRSACFGCLNYNDGKLFMFSLVMRAVRVSLSGRAAYAG